MQITWAITQDKVQATINKIVEFCKPYKIILFGSYVSGDMHLNSDLDVLVVTENDVENPRKESVRIRRALKGIMISMDILVVSNSNLIKMADTPGLIYREAINNGKMVYESTKE